MSDQLPSPASPSGPPGITDAKSSGTAAAPAGAPAEVKHLTPEEQMALFEKELKENDWGHQPC